MKRNLAALSALTLTIGLLLSCAPPVGMEASDASGRFIATPGIIPYYYYTPKGSTLSTMSVANAWECNSHSFAWQDFTKPVTEMDFPKPYYFLDTPAPFIIDKSVTLVGSCPNDGRTPWPAGVKSGDKVTFGSSPTACAYSATVEGNSDIMFYNRGDEEARIGIPWNFSQLRDTTMYFWHVSEDRFLRAPMGPRRLVALKSTASGKYLCADLFDNRGTYPANENWFLWTNRNDAADIWDSWEYFFIVQANNDDDQVYLWSQGAFKYVNACAAVRARANLSTTEGKMKNTTFTLVPNAGYHFQSHFNSRYMSYDSMTALYRSINANSRFEIIYKNRYAQNYRW